MKKKNLIVCTKRLDLTSNYKHIKFFHVESTSFAVRTEALLENYGRKIQTKVNLTTIYLNVNYIETGSRIFA